MVFRHALLLLLFCASARAAGPEAYESDRFRIALKRPGEKWTWSIPASDAAESNGKIGSINGTTGFQLLAKLTRDLRPEDPAYVNVTLDCFPQTPGHDDAAESAKKFTEAMRPNDVNFSLLESAREVAVDGRKGAFTELEVTLKRPEADGSRTAYAAHVRAWFFGIDGYWVRLIVSAKREQWGAVEPELKKLADSLRFPPPPSAIPSAPPAKSGNDEVLEGLRF